MENDIVNVLNGFDRIFSLNGYSVSSEDASYYKYMRLDRLVKNVEDRELIFVSPDLWQDPFEKLYHGIDCSCRGLMSTPEIACMCVTDKSSTNEEAMWKAYADNEKVVRVSFDANSLFALLSDYAKKNNCDIYIGRAIYKYSKDEIKSFYKNNLFCPSVMNVEHYLNLMLLKRVAFSYENEIRIFIVNKGGSTFYENGLVSVPVDYKEERLIGRVKLGPYPPINPKLFDAKLIKKRNNLEEELYKEKLKTLLECSVEQSRLYEPKSKIKAMR